MADGWQTYPFEFRGGLISNLSPLQHGTQAPALLPARARAGRGRAEERVAVASSEL